MMRSISLFTSVLILTILTVPAVAQYADAKKLDQQNQWIIGNPVDTRVITLDHSTFISEPVKRELKPINIPPKRDDPFDDWIFYDDGEPESHATDENYWSRVSFTPEERFILQGVSFMPYNPTGNDDDPCRILVYYEDQDNQNLSDLAWETELDQIEAWDEDDIDENWHFVEIPEDEWIEFDAEESFSIIYGPAPGGGSAFFDGFEDWEVGEPPGDPWVYQHGGESFCEVTDEEARIDDQSLHFVDPDPDEDANMATVLVEHQSLASGEYNFWLRLTPGGYFGFRAVRRDNNNNLSYGFLMQFNNDGSMLSNNGNQYAVVRGNWDREDWFEVRAEWGDGRFSIWFDQELIVDDWGLVIDEPINILWFLTFGDAGASIEDAWLDEVVISENGDDEDFGWWNLYDEGTDVERSYIFEGDEPAEEHEAWEVLEGDLLLRANGEYPPEGRVHTSRNISLRMGWNLVSANLQPDDEENIRGLMADLVEEERLLILKNSDGEFYNPDYDFNNIPGWYVDQGYLMLMRRAGVLTLEGMSVLYDDPIDLEQGWQIVSYYPRFEIETTTALSGIVDHLIIAKDGRGNFYLPDWDFSNMGNMREGRGYYLNVDADCELIYQREDDRAALSINDNHRHLPIHAVTPENMSLLVIEAASPFDSPPGNRGRELGVYASGELVGSGVLQDGVCGIAIWGDDPVTDEVDGAVEGDELVVRILGSNGLHSVSYVVLSGNTTYNANSFTVIKLNSYAEVPDVFRITAIYPNPFNARTTIQFGLPEPSNVLLTVYDLSGRNIATLVEGFMQPGFHSTVLSSDNLTSGVYFVRIAVSGERQNSCRSLMRKVMLIR